jgi:DNA-binding NarL/FixJ family response regulator
MDTEVALDVVDDGAGFDPDSVVPAGEAPDNRGFGLAAMRARARAAGHPGCGVLRRRGHRGGGHPAARGRRMIRLLLADDHPVVRAGLRAVLETEADFVVLAEAPTAIAARPGAPRVLVLTTYDTDADILAAIEAGAAGYLLKDAPPEELAAAVRTAAAEKSALAPAVALRLMDRMRSPDAALSRREIEVLQLVADGMSNLQISQQLFLSQATVKSHLEHVYTKLAVDSRTSAVAAATARGLIRR